jgi:membrane protein
MHRSHSSAEAGTSTTLGKGRIGTLPHKPPTQELLGRRACGFSRLARRHDGWACLGLGIVFSRTASAVREQRDRLAARPDLVGKALHVVNDDQHISGSLLAAGVAFRLFLMMLPLALLVASLFGFASAEKHSSPSTNVTGRDGLIVAMAKVIAQSGGEAHRARWVLLVSGVVLFLWAGSGVAQSIGRAYALVWRVPAPRGKGAIAMTLTVVAGLLCLVAVSLLSASALAASFELGIVALLVVPAASFGIWLLVTTQLPHGAPEWSALMPGALVFALGLTALQLVTSFLIASRVSHASKLYGSLGIVSTAMFWLYLGGRLIVASAGVNATLWRRRQGRV